MMVTEHGMIPHDLLFQGTLNVHIVPYSLSLSSWWRWKDSKNSKQLPPTGRSPTYGNSLISLPQEPPKDGEPYNNFDLLERTNFVMLRAGCDPNGTYGKRLRQALIDLYSNKNNLEGITWPVSGIDVKCDSANHEEARHDGHVGYQQRLQQSLFCLVTAGDTDSSLRLMETMAHGCVPVLVGPPFHTMSDIWQWSDLVISIYVHNQTWVVPDANNAHNPPHPETNNIFPGGWYHGGGWIESITSLQELPQKLVDVYYHRYHRVKTKLDDFRQTYLQLDDSVPFPVPVYMKKLMEQVLEEFHTSTTTTSAAGTKR
jgi:hypothetical protein